MRISDIQIKKRKESVTLSAQITFQGEKPQIMYFKVPREYESFLVADASPFFAALLLPAMKRKESIVIEDTVSAKLLSNASKIMKLFGEWKVGLSNVQIESKKANDAFTPAYAACFFSAGVDSFTTFLKNKELVKTKVISSDEKITHLILVHGFDIELL